MPARAPWRLAEERLDEAATWLSQALERNDTDPTVHANLGETLLATGPFRGCRRGTRAEPWP